MTGKALFPKCKRFLSAVTIILSAASCIQQNTVEQHFRSHGMTYPVDISRIGVFGVECAGIEDNELLEPGAREFVESGVMFIKEYFLGISPGAVIPGSKGFSLDKPVLYRSESGDVGLMVEITVYGSGRPYDVGLPVDWVGSDKKLWRAVNFAYFSRNGLNRWRYKGLVY